MLCFKAAISVSFVANTDDYSRKNKNERSMRSSQIKKKANNFAFSVKTTETSLSKKALFLWSTPTTYPKKFLVAPFTATSYQVMVLWKMKYYMRVNKCRIFSKLLLQQTISIHD